MTYTTASPFEQGRSAWYEGKDFLENPYPENTVENRDWSIGWDSIRLESEYINDD
jgi:hypothetical protein